MNGICRIYCLKVIQLFLYIGIYAYIYTDFHKLTDLYFLSRVFKNWVNVHK